ncbi:hypothetical protein PHIM7_207 [Sinorhizobium phage phiM7]|uniref:Uncharacterized protein n=3 Tax=Emdodecavirus TaxID=1980937 RepID=A0A068NXV6_9CAUD|nr:hypothetical protein AB690_gp299 [Sinorhizobium phage phiM12]YP_009212459.1 hypothetical protein AVT40_gp314 [Sinorhizobium phage phiN3]YP_009601332.1 hypothetical protein FDH46_gp271 [Sinorhizobium phage phiM7]AKF13112.1 hypothetical protein PHIM19_207 [Sinorhizobium phage phiM19]AIF27784.1 hypothetical protein SmphiM12_500 [Sinorhizobium phage phiM12]AKF12752.1 hypothetical protein PHIM7_207 [Sinorhizobium phage phiM7]AKF13482.1 hypothetical protein PHIN3_219 [Sinorhizobium phage phiN3]
MEALFVIFILVIVGGMIIVNRSRKTSTISQTAVVNGPNNRVIQSASTTVSRPVSSGYVPPVPASSHVDRRTDDSSDASSFAAAYVATSYYNDSYRSSSSCDSGSSSYDSGSSSSSYDSGSSSCGSSD